MIIFHCLSTPAWTTRTFELQHGTFRPSAALLGLCTVLMLCVTILMRQCWCCDSRGCHVLVHPEFNCLSMFLLTVRCRHGWKRDTPSCVLNLRFQVIQRLGRHSWDLIGKTFGTFFSARPSLEIPAPRPSELLNNAKHSFANSCNLYCNYNRRTKNGRQLS